MPRRAGGRCSYAKRGGGLQVTLVGIPSVSIVLTLSARIPLIRFLTGWFLTLLPPETFPSALQLFAPLQGVVLKVSAKVCPLSHDAPPPCFSRR
jgi:hypothetical protein